MNPGSFCSTITANNLFKRKPPFYLKLIVKLLFVQARAINELANKVFRVLKTNPENLEMEFLETRQRSARRAQNEAKNSFSSPTSPKIAANINSGSIMAEESLKPMPHSLCNSNPRRRYSDSFTVIDATEHEMLAGKM